MNQTKPNQTKHESNAAVGLSSSSLTPDYGAAFRNYSNHGIASLLLHLFRFRCRCLFPITLTCIVFLSLIGPLLDGNDDDDVTPFPDDQYEISARKKNHYALHSSRLDRDLGHGMSHCFSLRRPLADTGRTNSRWQYQNAKNASIIIYSAFYDDRVTDIVTPFIRALGIASRELRNASLFCHIWYEDYEQPYVTRAESTTIGRQGGYALSNGRYLQQMFSCRLPGIDPVPTHVSLVATDQCSNSTMYVPVERPVRSEPDHEFGICVAIAFGSVPLAEFVEWIEVNRMFGVTEVNIYDAGMVNMSTVFDYYTKQELLRVHSMPPPVPLDEKHKMVRTCV